MTLEETTMRGQTQYFLIIASFLSLLSSPVHFLPTEPPISRFIRAEIIYLQQYQRIDNHTPVYCIPDIIREYTQNKYSPIWDRQKQITSFLNLLEKADSEGLSPSDYHLYSLKRLVTSKSKDDIAKCDILMTDAFLLYISHLSSGKVDPSQYTARWNAGVRSINLSAYLHQLGNEKVADIIAEISPHAAEYNRLKRALKKYRQISQHHSWQRIEISKNIEPGDKDQRITVIRKRLKTLGFLVNSKSAEPDIYDDTLKNAVLAFQRHHGIVADGIIGTQTIEMLNITPENMVGRIRVNMERWRWLPPDLGRYYVFVNSANFELKVVKNGKAISKNRVIVGRPYRKTPILSSQIEYLVFNPSWIIPRGILTKDILPLVRKNVRYLKKEHIRVINDNGRFVDPKTIDWNDNNLADEYLFRQDAGKNNSLGRIKFVFPNSYSIYLHDTPAKELFNSRKRTFSSGCIRVEKALDLAHLLLDDEIYWSMDYIQLVVQSGNYQMVPLRTKPPIYVTYFTFWVGDDGSYQLRKDIYQRDPRVLSALLQEPPSTLN